MSRTSVSNPSQRIELTERQEAVVRLIDRGLTNAEIGERLGVTLDGVKWHVREILGKFGVESREEAAARWREQRSAGRRVRMWGAGIWASTAVRWASGLAVAGGAGVAGTAAMVNSLQADEDEAPVLPAVVAVATPDLSLADGLKLMIESVRADQTQTVMTFTLEGRPELGRISQPPQGIIVDAGSGRLDTMPWEAHDEDGNEYMWRSWSADPANLRRIIVTLGPLAETAESVTITLAGMPFVAPAFETKEGEKPPSPSEVVDGPWTASAVEIAQLATDEVLLPAQPKPFGPTSIALERVVHTDTDTVLYASITAWPQKFEGVFLPTWQLTAADGSIVPSTSGRWGDDGPIEIRFPRTSGTVTLTITGGGRSPLDQIEPTVLTPGGAEATEPAYRADARRLLGEAAAELQAYFDAQEPATWTFTIP